jgi:hypothetical protein
MNMTNEEKKEIVAIVLKAGGKYEKYALEFLSKQSEYAHNHEKESYLDCMALISFLCLVIYPEINRAISQPTKKRKGEIEWGRGKFPKE